MNRKETNPPIFFIVGQIKFNEVLDMRDYLSGIQKIWRAGFPDFSEDAVGNVQIHIPGPGRPPEVSNTTAPRWHFKDIARTSGYVLQRDSVSFHTTAYSHSDAFVKALADGLETVHSVVKLAFSSRVSVRTLDAIVPEGTEKISDYFDAGLLGLHEKLNGKLRQSLSQTIVQLESGNLTSRAVILDGKIGFPADLNPLPLALQSRFLAIKGVHAILDNDFAIDERLTIDKALITERIRKVKTTVSEAFWKALHPSAVEMWSGNVG